MTALDYCEDPPEYRLPTFVVYTQELGCNFYIDVANAQNAGNGFGTQPHEAATKVLDPDWIAR
ncbi:hypothetical protein [Marivita sp. S2033]|uniref:hypothetical protein n=1 Tax=Marivita sp. S2033 TaxID=3373187 RepID=UPI003981D5AE